MDAPDLARGKPAPGPGRARRPARRGTSGAEASDSMKERLKDSEREEVDRILSVIKWQRLKRRASHRNINGNPFQDSTLPALFTPVSEIEVKNGVKLVVPPVYDELVERQGYGNLPSYDELAISECLLKLPITARHLDAILLDGGRRWEAAAKAQFPMFFQSSKQSILGSVFSNQQNGPDRLRREDSSPWRKSSTVEMNTSPMDLKSVEPSPPSSNRSKSSNNLVRPPILNPQSENKGAGRRIAVMLKSGARKNQITPQKPGEKKPNTSTTQSHNRNQIHIEKKKTIQEDLRLRKLWSMICRKEISKGHRTIVSQAKRFTQEAKRLVEQCQKEVKAKNLRSVREAQKTRQHLRTLLRDSLAFVKKCDREETDADRKWDKEVMEYKKAQDELREARRQQQRLNFLLTQTELYSHFMRGKEGSSAPRHDPTQLEVEATLARYTDEERDVLTSAVDKYGKDEWELILTDPDYSGHLANLTVDQLRDKWKAIEYYSKTNNMKNTEAERDEVQSMALQAQQQAVIASSEHAATLEEFDQETENERMNSKDTSMLNPSTMPEASQVSQPAGFNGQLKEYQLRGLQWLANLYEQGLNGILADEMGLGKTIQALVFLQHLAETKGLWGPFVVVAPASTLPNWADEVRKFTPRLKFLPYWGDARERALLRKNMQSHRLGSPNSPFHILVTSYQLLVADEKSFRRVRWQYMVADEAQALKSSSSQRWKTLLGFRSRNRLLLTGTPIQNSMAELWALLHFIMPQLFDSHASFQEWFAQGIEGHVQSGEQLNEHQLSRLRAVLKPFMLRRVKKDVEAEMAQKTEITCTTLLSRRQQELYHAIRSKLSIQDLLASLSNDDKAAQNLMNIVVQLRKVCNHPELFERLELKMPFVFKDLSKSEAPSEQGVIENSTMQNPIELNFPRSAFGSGNYFDSMDEINLVWKNTVIFRRYLSISDPQYIYDSFYNQEHSFWSFLRLLRRGFSPWSCSSYLTKYGPIECWLIDQLAGLEDTVNKGYKAQLYDIPMGRSMAYLIPFPRESPVLQEARVIESEIGYVKLGPLVKDARSRWQDQARPLKSMFCYIPNVIAAPPRIHASSSAFQQTYDRNLNDLVPNLVIRGHLPLGKSELPSLQKELCDFYSENPRGLLENTYWFLGSWSRIQTSNFAKLLADSGKLQLLDKMLDRLYKDGHRVLIFCQMTKMMDLLTEYLEYRRYEYFRLDGSTPIQERKEMVSAFQKQGKGFCFILSTRSGGLGINLTAADTVIFYEIDWNPTCDAQAMDRAHRLGQTKKVMVYRLVTKSTVEEKILARAMQKAKVQQLVINADGKSSTDMDDMGAKDALALLVDDDEMHQLTHSFQQRKKGTKRLNRTGPKSVMGKEKEAETASKRQKTDPDAKT